ncbi:MAG: M20/M25/M40 family metallo-hydrolase, partial [Acidobacteria bacterium]|nr:M20/M25/M40 family metallo-hydrolase [Acidobacteriota bacterium]
MKHIFGASVLLALSIGPAVDAAVPSPAARDAADHALATYGEALVETVGDLVAFETGHQEGLANAENPHFRAMTAYLRQKAEQLGLDFSDYGEVVVVGLGEGSERLGVITHGDVQPAESRKWARTPFFLDRESEPGRLIGRGVEDDKGPIATALYAMKAVKDRGIPMKRRVELIISYTEESDWEPFRAFLEAHPPPQMNVAIDSDYPVVVAEKGWGAVQIIVP